MRYVSVCSVLIFLLLLQVGCDQQPNPSTSASGDAVPQRLDDDSAPDDSLQAVIENRFVVVLTNQTADINVEAEAERLSEAYELKLERTFQGALNGFSAYVESSEQLEALQEDSAVSYAEADGLVSTSIWTQPNPPSWGLDRVDEMYLPMNGAYRWFYSGADVTAYVIDTGIDPTHPDFGGRASIGTTFVGGLTGKDCNGHGTHVAGTIAGTDYGVAKNARVVGVQVLSCSGWGTWSDVISGVNWVTLHADSSAAVANMSLGGGHNTAVNQAVQASIQSGVTYAIAASNNFFNNACNYSPASVTEALTTGATTVEDDIANFSNVGPCVDLYAPGQEITSTWLNQGTSTISGTSMASPHVAAIAAKMKQRYPNASPPVVNTLVKGTATPFVLNNVPTNTPNLLANSWACPINMLSQVYWKSSLAKSEEIDPRPTEDTEPILRTIHEFREEVMRRSEAGADYIDRYWTHSLEIAWIMVNDRELWKDAHQTLVEVQPVLKEATSGETSLSSTQMKQIDEQLGRVQKQAGDELAEVLDRARADLRTPDVMRQFNIFIE